MLIDDRTRVRIVMVIFASFMTGALGIRNWVLTFLIVVLVAAVASTLWRRWDAVCEAEEAARKAKRDALWKRMQEQHQQTLAGDERGVYGDGYEEHVAFQDAVWERHRRALADAPRPNCGCPSCRKGLGRDESPSAEAEGEGVL